MSYIDTLATSAIGRASVWEQDDCERGRVINFDSDRFAGL
jgi:hypothetical protein